MTTWSLAKGQHVTVRGFGLGTVRHGGERQFHYIVDFDRGPDGICVSVDNIRLLSDDRLAWDRKVRA